MLPRDQQASVYRRRQRRWKNVTGRMEYHLDIFHKSAGSDIQEFKALVQPGQPHSRTPEHLEDIQASREAAAALSGQMFADPPRPIKRVDGTVTTEMAAAAAKKRKPFAVASQPSVALISSKQRFSPVFDTRQDTPNSELKTQNSKLLNKKTLDPRQLQTLKLEHP